MIGVLCPIELTGDYYFDFTHTTDHSVSGKEGEFPTPGLIRLDTGHKSEIGGNRNQTLLDTGQKSVESMQNRVKLCQTQVGNQ